MFLVTSSVTLRTLHTSPFPCTPHPSLAHLTLPLHTSPSPCAPHPSLAHLTLPLHTSPFPAHLTLTLHTSPFPCTPHPSLAHLTLPLHTSPSPCTPHPSLASHFPLHLQLVSFVIVAYFSVVRCFLFERCWTPGNVERRNT